MKLKWLPEYLSIIGYNKGKKIVPMVAVYLFINAIELASIMLIFPIIQAFLDFHSFEGGRFYKLLVQITNIEGARDVSMLLVSVLACIILLRGVVTYIGNKWVYTNLSRDEAAFSVAQYTNVLNESFSNLQSQETSKIIRDVAIAIPLGFSTVLQAFLTILSEVFVFVGLAFYLLVLSPSFFMCVLFILLIAAFVYMKMIGPVLTRLGWERHDLSHRTIGVISQSLEGIAQIKNWQSETFFADIFAVQRHKQADITASLMAIQNIPRLYFESIVMLIICAGMSYFMVSEIPVIEFLPILGFYVIAAFRVLPSILRMSAQFNVLSASLPAIETIMSFGDYAPTTNIQYSPIPAKYSLALDCVSFSYEDHTIIKDLSLKIKSGEMIGISGRSGEGKTTLINILSGLIHQDSGNICIDGVIVDDARVLLSTVGYVSQNTFLLNDTIRANVAFGQKREEIDDDKVWRALRFAQLDIFVNELPETIYTAVGERGGRLSGGQRQRIGIARAFYFDRDILIMDEATASLDNETEKSLCDVLKTLKGKTTTILISHKALPLSICDKVYTMSQGQLILK